MNIMFAGMIGGWEVIVILAVVLILFGSKKLPELARGLGQGIREFKKATREVTDEIQTAGDVDAPVQPQRRLPANNPRPLDEPHVVAQSPSPSEPKA
jgi:sec-independent protein translocase protein TatA